MITRSGFGSSLYMPNGNEHKKSNLWDVARVQLPPVPELLQAVVVMALAEQVDAIN